MKKSIIRYGILPILIIIAIGLVFILSSLSTREKVPILLFVTDTYKAKAYIAPPAPIFKPNNTVEITESSFGNIAFKVDTAYTECSDQVLMLTTTDTTKTMQQRLAGRTHTQGYIYTGHIPLLRLILKRIY